MRGTEEGSINQYLADTIASVFGSVMTVDVNGSTNRELFASDNADMLAVMKANTENLASEDLKRLMNYVSLSMEDYRAGSYLMTDDKAPVELLGMRVIDSLIQEKVSYYKDIYTEQGIEGLLNNL